MSLDLMVRGSEWNIELDVRKFPLICSTCGNYLSKIYEHKGSTYGQVGRVKCDCGADLTLTDSDKAVEYINIQIGAQKTVLDFKELFQMRGVDFEKLNTVYGYHMYKKHLDRRVKLDHLIINIERHLRKELSPIKTDFPATDGIKKWMGLMQN